MMNSEDEERRIENEGICLIEKKDDLVEQMKDLTCTCDGNLKMKMRMLVVVVGGWQVVVEVVECG